MKISQYSQIASTAITPSVFMPVVDPLNPAMAASGTTDRMTIGQLLPGVLWPSGDATGVKDAAAINAAVTAGNKFITLMPTATWYIACGQVVINKTGVYINAPGCYILAVGAGDVFRMYDSSAYSPRIPKGGGGFLGFPMIDLANTTGNSSGVHAGDIYQLQVFVQVRNANAGTTSKGVWFDSQYFQTEGLSARIFAQSCTTGVMFDNSTGTSLSASANGSYDRLNCDIFIENNAVGDGVTFTNGAFNVDAAARLGIYGNWQTSSTTTYSALKLIGSSVASGFSNYSFGQLVMGCELDSTGVHNPQTITFGSGSNAVFKCTGFLDFSQGSAWTSTNAAGNMLFSGPAFGDTNLVSLVSLGSPTFVQAISANGQTIFTAYLQTNKLTGAGGFTGLILSSGAFDGQTITLISTSTGTLTFAVPATSHVAQGTGAVLTQNIPRTFTWVAADALWY